MSKVAFYVQFRRSRGYIDPIAMTKTAPRMPRRGTGAVVVKFLAEIPAWVFDPLDLVASVEVPASAAEPLIRLEAVGPVIEPPEEPGDPS